MHLQLAFNDNYDQNINQAGFNMLYSKVEDKEID